MPPRRSSRQVSKESEDEDGQSIQQHKKKENSQWICFINNDALEIDPNNENKTTFCKLRHPKTDRSAMFLFCNGDKDVFEVSVFSEDCRSWLIDNTVQQDGSLHITTPIDPLFLILPYILKVKERGMYMTLDQIVCDPDFPECSRLVNTSGTSELHNITDIKGSDDLQAYRYNEEKLLSWLQSKIEHLAEKLSEREICVSGAQSSTYVRTKRAMTATHDDYIRYAYGMVCDYIPTDVSARLKEHMKIPEVVEKKENEPPSKKAKMDDITPTEDYSQGKSEVKSAKASKLTVGQKKLSKVDKSGMKSLASFFSPKAKT
ncbi:ribonuclease H2 subunit B-like [Saccostrea echinata]|uniref:ribonuclease H2 subunit B-like n=1 Tax=Saccostrea echinata TaxID=191078 RepID=UPI002A7ECF5E|nr:ribonuclease H2 subunit B-like [Saccostrea echinata]